jgi:hypothetical protein
VLTEQIITINPYKLIQTFFAIILKIYLFFQNKANIYSEINLNNPKGASFKENHLMTTARDALRTTFIFRLRTLENNLNFLNQSKYA